MYMSLKNCVVQLGMMVLALILAVGGQKQVDLCGAILLYIASSRTPRAIQRETLFQKQKTYRVSEITHSLLTVPFFQTWILIRGKKGRKHRQPVQWGWDQVGFSKCYLPPNLELWCVQYVQHGEGASQSWWKVSASSSFRLQTPGRRVRFSVYDCVCTEARRGHWVYFLFYYSVCVCVGIGNQGRTLVILYHSLPCFLETGPLI